MIILSSFTLFSIFFEFLAANAYLFFASKEGKPSRVPRFFSRKVFLCYAETGCFYGRFFPETVDRLEHVFFVIIRAIHVYFLLFRIYLDAQAITANKPQKVMRKFEVCDFRCFFSAFSISPLFLTVGLF